MEFFFDHSKPKKKKEGYGKLVVQQKMRLAMAFLNPLRPIVHDGWSAYGNGKKSKAFGQALRKVMQDGIEGDYPEQRILPDRVLLSMGSLPVPQITDVVRDQATLEVFLESPSHPMAKPADELVLIVFNPEIGIGAKNDQVFYRKDNHLEVKLPPQFKEEYFYAYLYCHNTKKTRFSKSVYLGYFEPSIST